jgi:hypothetical protein
VNQQSEITEVRNRIGEPYREDPTDNFLLDEEISSWIYQGELQVARDLHFEALFSLQTEATGTTVTAQANYTIAGLITALDYFRILGVTYSPEGITGKRRICNMVQPREFQLAQSSPSFNRIGNYEAPTATIINNSIWVLPAPITGAATCIGVRYLKRPAKRFKRYRGSVTSISGSGIIYDTKAAAKGLLNDHFNNCELVFTSGSEIGEWNTVADYVTATGEFTLTVGSGGNTVATHTVGAEFEVGTVSDLSVDLWPLYLQWVMYLAKLKDNHAEAEAYKATYFEMVKTANAHWAGSLQEVVA